jgi:hypothetical protein
MQARMYDVQDVVYQEATHRNYLGWLTGYDESSTRPSKMVNRMCRRSSRYSKQCRVCSEGEDVSRVTRWRPATISSSNSRWQTPSLHDGYILPAAPWHIEMTTPRGNLEKLYARLQVLAKNRNNVTPIHYCCCWGPSQNQKPKDPVRYPRSRAERRRKVRGEESNNLWQRATARYRSTNNKRQVYKQDDNQLQKRG